MLRKFTSILLAVLVAIGIFVPTVLAEEKITLTVLNYFDLTSPGAERELEEVWQVLPPQS